MATRVSINKKIKKAERKERKLAKKVTKLRRQWTIAEKACVHMQKIIDALKHKGLGETKG